MNYTDSMIGVSSSMTSSGEMASSALNNVTEASNDLGLTSASSSIFLNSTAAQNTTSSNSSLVWAQKKNSSEEQEVEVVDLEALNLSMSQALMPTIVYLALIMVVGVAGNTVVMLVYYRRFKPSATRTYVLAMSVCDFLANVLSLPSEILDIRYFYTFDLPFVCKGVRGFNSFITLISAFVLVAVASDRFSKVCQPLKKHVPMRRIYTNVLICFLVSLALSVVFGALNGSQTIPTGVGNSTGITCSVSDAFKDTLFPLIYNMIMALSFITCVVIMVVSYVRIALELWRHKKKQERMSGAAAMTKTFAGKGAGKASSEMKDTSSGPVHDSLPSDSSAELIPKKTGNKVNKTDKTASSARSDSGKQVVLSFKNLNYEGPGSSVEDSDEGCFSGGSAETTSTSVDICKETQAKNDLEGQSDVTITITGTPATATSPKDHTTTSRNTTKTMTSNASRMINPKDTSAPDKTSDLHHDIQPAVENEASSPPRVRGNLITGFRSFARRSFHAINTRREKKKKKKGTAAVKAIPSSTTLMMFVLTATFIINYLPHLVIISLRATSDTFGEGLTGAGLYLYNIGLRSYFMNCGVNSLVYGFCSARFRHECRQLFARK